jgi:F-type H+-transporting ATPase subunit gamma
MLAGLLQSEDLRESLGKELGMSSRNGKSPVVLQDVDMDVLPSKKDAERVALVVFSSNSSLCGAFNANVIRKFNETVARLREHGYDLKDIDVFAIGKKAADAAVKAGFQLDEDFTDLADKPSYDRAVDLASELIDRFSDGEVEQVIFIYSHMASTSSQPVIRENYLPLALHDYASGAYPEDYILEPDPMSLVKELLPKVLLLKMYTVVLDANAAEHAARTVAMQVATDNAQDLISELTLAYNKGRQQEITAEILDLIGGTMA